MAFVDTEQRPAGEVQQKVGRIKLSEAIRIGARIRPQHFGLEDARLTGRSCVLGAAEEALTGKYPVGGVPSAGFNFGCEDSIIERVWRMNDYDKMSRESIADWLEAQGL